MCKSLLHLSRKHQKMWTTLTQILLRKSPPSRQSMAPWSLPSTKTSFWISLSLLLTCWRAWSLHTDISLWALLTVCRQLPGVQIICGCHILWGHESVKYRELSQTCDPLRSGPHVMNTKAQMCLPNRLLKFYNPGAFMRVSGIISNMLMTFFNCLHCRIFTAF